MRFHKQIHSFLSALPTPVSIDFQPVRLKSKRKYSNLISTDQYFAQPQQLFHGDVDASVYAVQSNAAAAHVQPLDGNVYSKSNLSDADLHAAVISKHCSTIAETAALASSFVKPVESDYVDVQSPTPEQPVVSE